MLGVAFNLIYGCEEDIGMVHATTQYLSCFSLLCDSQREIMSNSIFINDANCYEFLSRVNLNKVTLMHC